ncbi:MAG: lytic murein transglycosylase, partial [Halocynthiibacter sp.]
MRFSSFLAGAALLISTTTAYAQSCGGGFNNFVNGLKREARQSGHDRATVDRFFANVRQDQATLRADRSQGVFQKDFLEFSQRLISQGRIDNGRRNAQR